MLSHVLHEATSPAVAGPHAWIGMAFALTGAVLLAFSAQLQHAAVAVVEDPQGSKSNTGLTIRQLAGLLRQPSWVLGTLLLGMAIVAQLAALAFAPLIVVQPLGVVALLVTAAVNTRVSRTRLTPKAILAISLCVVGVATFVVIAAVYAAEPVIGDGELLLVLVLLGLLLLVLSLMFALRRKRLTVIFYIAGAGMLYGFVATLAKIVINRLVNNNFEWLTVSCVAALLAAMALGAYFVQTAHSVGSPDLVVAGLTVIDPLVAVAIGIFVLGEAAATPVWAVLIWVVAGAVAVFGVFQLEHSRRRVPIGTPSSSEPGVLVPRTTDRERG